MNKTFKQKIIDWNTFNFLDLPWTWLFKFEIICMTWSTIERVLNKNKWINIYWISHLIEHLSFKTSLDYTTDELWELLLNEWHFNASTNYDRINYWFKTISSNFELAINLVSNIAFNNLTKVEDKDFISERDTVFNEAKSTFDKPTTIFYRDAKTCISELDIEDTVIWIPERIKTFSLNDVIEIKKYFLSKGNFVFNITFDSLSWLDKNTIVSKITECFSRFNFYDDFSIVKLDYYNSLATYRPWIFNISNESKQKLHFLMFDVINDSITSDYTTIYLNELSWKDSIFNLIREQNGLSYSPHLWEFYFWSKFYVLFTCDVTRWTEEKMLSLLKESINNTCDNFTKENYNKLIKTINLDRKISFVNQNFYWELFSLALWDNKTFLKYKNILSVNVDKAYDMIESESWSFDSINEQLINLKNSINTWDYAIVSN